MKNHDILFCIFNYKQKYNAEWLYHHIKPEFDCKLLDAASGETPDALGGDTIYLDNVFYGGMLHKAIEVLLDGEYKYLFLICSDVIISEENITRLKHILLTEDFTNTGVYCPVHQDDSYTWVSWSYRRATNGRRPVAFIEGMLSMYSVEVCEYMFPTNTNPLGWGFDIAACYFAQYMYCQTCEVDDRVQIYHPKGDTGKNPMARTQSRNYFARYKDGYSIRWWWIRLALRNASLQPFILFANYRRTLKYYLKVYRFLIELFK